MGQPMDEGGIRVPSWVRDLVSDAPSSIPTAPTSQRDPADRARARAARELRRIIYAAIRKFSDTLSWSFSVPGDYGNGLTFDELLAILASKGKDFGEDTATLRRRVRDALMSEYEDADAIPLALEFRETAAESILGTIVARLENRLRDVRITPNTFPYDKWKAAKGYDSRIGVRTGRLLRNVTNRGKVTVRASTR